MAKQKKPRNKKYNPNKVAIRLLPNGLPTAPALYANTASCNLPYEEEHIDEMENLLKDKYQMLVRGELDADGFYFLHRRTYLLHRTINAILKDTKINGDEKLVTEVRLRLIGLDYDITTNILPTLLDIFEYRKRKGKYLADLKQMKIIEKITLYVREILNLASIGNVTKAAKETEDYYEIFLHKLAKDTRLSLIKESPAVYQIAKFKYGRELLNSN